MTKFPLYMYHIVPFYLLIFFISTPFSHGDSEIPHRVLFVESPIQVDAVLDEEAWGKALILRPNIEVRPGENISAPVKSEVLFAYSTTHLYIAFRCFDPDPGQIRAHLTDCDDIWDDDWIAVILDTFNDERRTIDFFCNPLGVQADQIESPHGEDSAWDAIWDSDGRITSDGYIVEMALPFSVFPFQDTDGDQIDYANNRKGSKFRISPWLFISSCRHISAILSHNSEKLKVSGGSLYNANISSITTVYQFSRGAFLRTIVQYAFNNYNTSLYIEEIDSESRHLQSQVLFSYKVNPKTMLYLGYSDNHTGNHEIKLIRTNRTFFMKIGYAWIL